MAALEKVGNTDESTGSRRDALARPFVQAHFHRARNTSFINPSLFASHILLSSAGCHFHDPAIPSRGPREEAALVPHTLPLLWALISPLNFNAVLLIAAIIYFHRRLTFLPIKMLLQFNRKVSSYLPIKASQGSRARLRSITLIAGQRILNYNSY